MSSYSPSFPRRRESRMLDRLDSRLRRNDRIQPWLSLRRPNCTLATTESAQKTASSSSWPCVVPVFPSFSHLHARRMRSDDLLQQLINRSAQQCRCVTPPGRQQDAVVADEHSTAPHAQPVIDDADRLIKVRCSVSVEPRSSHPQSTACLIEQHGPAVTLNKLWKLD